MTETTNPQNDMLLKVEGLKKFFPIRRGLLRRIIGHVKAVDDVSFHIVKGETLGLVGESGSGKTTAARLILRAYEPTAGTVRFRREDGVWVNRGGTVDVEANCVTLRDVTAFSHWTIGDSISAGNTEPTAVKGGPLQAYTVPVGVLGTLALLGGWGIVRRRRIGRQF